MAIKGSIAKKQVMNDILKLYGDRAFLYNDDKEIRINCTEEGQLVQIKLTLTAAKTAVMQGDDNALPGDAVAAVNTDPIEVNSDKGYVEPTAEEKANVAELLRSFGL